MYLRSLRVQNLKRLRDLKLDLTRDGKPRMWTVLIGENGTAKTTILHAIALAATGSKQVNTLAGPIVTHLADRRSEADVAIDATFDFSERSMRSDVAHPWIPRSQRVGLKLVSKVTLGRGSTSLGGNARYQQQSAGHMSSKPRKAPDDPLDGARDVHLPLWFVVGYGIARVLPDATETPTLARPSIERIAPLFGRQGLASTSFANHFLKKDAEEGRRRGTTSRMFNRVLNAAIKLGGQDLLPHIDKLELRGQGGAPSSADLIESDRFHLREGKRRLKIPGVALSHGYQSTFAWIADLIGHVLLEADSEVHTVDMEGLVLLDEIDLYLHPKWQATFVTALRRVFPKMQFVATTHSPVVLADLAPDEIVRLIVDEDSGDVVVGGWDRETGVLGPANGHSSAPPDPRPMTGSELYRTWFGIDRLTPNPHGEELRRYLVLQGDSAPTPGDARELKGLAVALRKANVLPTLGAPKKGRS